jgi:GxxExxY protein
MFVENKVIVEIKSVENLAPVRFSQTLTYLKLALFIDFNTRFLKDGIHRIVNKLHSTCKFFLKANEAMRL